MNNDYDEFNHEYDSRKMREIIDQHSDLRRAELQKAYDDALEKSQSTKKTKYNRKEPVNLKRWGAGILAGIAIAVATVPSISNEINEILDGKRYIGIPYDSNNKDGYADKYDKEVEENIQKLIESMGTKGSDSTRIKTITSDVSSNGPVFNFDLLRMNLSAKVKSATEVSNSYTRCVIYAAAKILNEGYKDYREDKLNILFQELSSDEEFMANLPDDCYYLRAKNSQDFLEMLGYKSWNEYEKNEKEEIKELLIIEKTISTPATGRKYG